MTAIHPCRHCPRRPDCADRADAVSAMSKGPLKVTVARLSCPAYAGLFVAGDRVEATIGGRLVGTVTVRGTITGASAKRPGKWVVQVDEDYVDSTGLQGDWEGRGETDARPFLAVYPNRLTRLDEPRRAICSRCGNAMTADGRHANPKAQGECDGFQAWSDDDGSDF